MLHTEICHNILNPHTLLWTPQNFAMCCKSCYWNFRTHGLCKMNSYLIWVILKLPSSQKAATFSIMSQLASANLSILQPFEYAPAIQSVPVRVCSSQPISIISTAGPIHTAEPDSHAWSDLSRVQQLHPTRV